MLMIQIPTDVPGPNNNTPIDFNNVIDVLLYIVAPVLLFVLYLYFRKKSRSIKTNDDSVDK